MKILPSISAEQKSDLAAGGPPVGDSKNHEAEAGSNVCNVFGARVKPEDGL